VDSRRVTEQRTCSLLSLSTFCWLECRTKTANVQEGETVAIFGLGAVGLAVVQGAVGRKASRVIAIDTNDSKKEWAEKFGATEFINPMKLEKGVSIVDHLVKITDGGLDYTLYVPPLLLPSFLCWLRE
jgi:S-(hydroxymethyl)glutathione dehydrogenase/alcohol dehydrogenase